MRVAVRLIGVFRDFGGPGRRSAVELDFEGHQVRIGELRARLGIPVDFPRLVFVRGRPAEEDLCLSDGDEVTFVSPIAGG